MGLFKVPRFIFGKEDIKWDSFQGGTCGGTGAQPTPKVERSGDYAWQNYASLDECERCSMRHLGTEKFVSTVI